MAKQPHLWRCLLQGRLREARDAKWHSTSGCSLVCSAHNLSSEQLRSMLSGKTCACREGLLKHFTSSENLSSQPTCEKWFMRATSAAQRFLQRYSLKSNGGTGKEMLRKIMHATPQSTECQLSNASCVPYFMYNRRLLMMDRTVGDSSGETAPFVAMPITGKTERGT